VQDGHVRDRNPLGEDEEDVPAGCDADAADVTRGTSAVIEAREPAEGWLKGGCDVNPVHKMALNPFQDFMAQHSLCNQERTSCPVVYVCAGEG
jgi:hypothetical protein